MPATDGSKSKAGGEAKATSPPTSISINNNKKNNNKKNVPTSIMSSTSQPSSASAVEEGSGGGSKSKVGGGEPSTSPRPSNDNNNETNHKKEDDEGRTGGKHNEGRGRRNRNRRQRKKEAVRRGAGGGASKPVSVDEPRPLTTNNAPDATITINESTLTLQTANRLMTALETESKRRNLNMVFAITDQHGNLKCFHRMDGSIAISIKAAQAKAYTISSLPMTTKECGVISNNTPSNPYAFVDGFLTLAGGVPIFNDEGVQLGGLGVSGDSPEVDEEIAIVGVNAVDGISYTR